MKRLIAAGVLGLAAVGFAHTSVAEAAGLDVWNLPRLHDELDDATEARADLDARDEAVSQRITVKDQLVVDLVAGRATLAAVTEAFLALNQDTETMACVRRAYPSPSADDRETTARNVLGFADVARYPSAAAKAAVRGRLAAEYRAMFPPAR